ncbi:TPA: tyrosine-type recombinase/integrase [Vibrio vulnificus]|uniref:tyrosine-type recombinase/integrase n=1 Tax=Vibrio vulnificus TaxID=672 RepID=UPI000CD28821|nr:site-specific integrase [Vibrio vulnificus]POB17552.1 site-specific recombinase [Vibrio vulnificus]HAS6021811.1 tyrosine-type recombinase/integrase [Vibrio vulnificus]HDY8021111.1 site-specific integrase [Vibrio vulnificus]
MKSLLFTSKVIESLNSKTRTYTVWDTQVPALGVRVYTDGRRFYVTHLSIPNKTLAAVGQLTLKKVRQHVRALQASFLDKETKPIRLLRFDALVKEEWTDKVCKGWKLGTQGTASSALKKHLLPEFGRFPVSRIDSCHVHRWFDELSQSYAGTANRNLDVLRSIFKYAVKQGYCIDNPCDGLKQNRKRKLNRFLSLDELARLHNALTVVSQQGDIEACCCQVLKLVLLTGCRISEVTGLQWSFVKGREWHLPDSKTGAKVVYVGKEAQQLLSDIPQQVWTQRSESHDDVFMPLRRFVSRSTKVSMVWQQVRALAHIEDVRIHDLRHTFASYAVLEGYPIPMVSKLLGHTRISSTLRYAHVDDAQVSQSAEAIGEVISGILSGQLVSTPKTRKVRASGLKPTKSPLKCRGRPIKAIPELTDEEVERLRYEVEFWEW